ncbi:GAF domain-containing sensor histidine kinase [Salinicoccus sp. HZC-1]|uniref:GAF domain-containing sensor histidine kinase n=1 Tax=Salinicoccus sp. HZC-1 TaxID=3385497 RepID=UPI00398B1B17
MKSKLQLLKDIAEFLNEETDRNTMIDGALRLLIDHSDFETGWIFFIDNEGNPELKAHYQLPPSLEKEGYHHLCEGKCWCVNKYNNKELERATNIFVCSRLEKARMEYPDENNNITHHATVPLISGDESFGLLNIASPYTEQFAKDELDLLESVAFQIGSTLKRIELNAQEQENMIIMERQRLARDLHDSVNQMLFSIGITSHAAKTLDNKEKLSDAFDSIENTSKHAMKEMKALIWQLKPIGLEKGIIDAIEKYADLLGIELEVTVSGFYDVPDNVEVGLYRVMQEGLNNVRKHSGSAKAEIVIRSKADELEIHIMDDGIGFDQKEKSGYSYGLGNMKDRVKKLGGILDIQSQKGNGTTVKVIVPIGE